MTIKNIEFTLFIFRWCPFLAFKSKKKHANKQIKYNTEYCIIERFHYISIWIDVLYFLIPDLTINFLHHFPFFNHSWLMVVLSVFSWCISFEAQSKIKVSRENWTSNPLHVTTDYHFKLMLCTFITWIFNRSKWQIRNWNFDWFVFDIFVRSTKFYLINFVWHEVKCI